MTPREYAPVEMAGKDPDDWPQLTTANGRKFERQFDEAQDDDLLDGVDLDGVHFFVHKREVTRVTYWP
jgi:hypothetical protein